VIHIRYIYFLERLKEVVF
jgi:sphinganine-1-phosphate aldolase